MIVPRKTVIWSGIVAVILFAIINRVRLYVNSEIVFAEAYLDGVSIKFQYKGDTFIYDCKYAANKDTSLPIKILIPFQTPGDFIVFDFMNFIFWVILLVIFMSGGWILFLQSFFPKRDKFFLFKTKKEPDE